MCDACVYDAGCTAGGAIGAVVASASSPREVAMNIYLTLPRLCALMRATAFMRATALVNELLGGIGARISAHTV